MLGRRLPGPPSGWPRELIKAAILIWVVWLVYAPARGMREDIAIQRDLTRQQFALGKDLQRIADTQLQDVRRTRDFAEQALGQGEGLSKTVEQALAEARRSRRIAERTLAEAEAAVDVAERNLAVVQTVEGRTDEALALLRQQLAVARETLHVARETLAQVKEINDKTPGSTRLVP